MAFNTRISNAMAIDACNLHVDKADGGYSEIRDGLQPNSVDDAATGTLLGRVDFGTPAFGDAVDVNPGARATANPITGDTGADAGGTPTWFRVYASDDTPLWDGTAGISGTDMILSRATTVIGEPINVLSWTFTQGESN